MKTLHLTTYLALALALPLSAQQIQISKENKTIAITTSDDASALADTAVVSIGFTAYGKDQAGTYADASRTSNAITNALTSADVPKDAIQSNDQGISPLSPDGDEGRTRYNQGLRFQFNQSWTVTIPAAQAANILHLAIMSGANNSGNIQWQMLHDDTLESEAAKKALQHARTVAERMAQGLGVKLGSLIYASNQAQSRVLMDQNTPAPMAMRAFKAERPDVKPLALSPERITRSATVYAVFSIE
jgi:uncharacterized protein YggE